MTGWWVLITRPSSSSLVVVGNRQGRFLSPSANTVVVSSYVIILSLTSRRKFYTNSRTVGEGAKWAGRNLHEIRIRRNSVEIEITFISGGRNMMSLSKGEEKTKRKMFGGDRHKCSSYIWRGGRESARERDRESRWRSSRFVASANYVASFLPVAQ